MRSSKRFSLFVTVLLLGVDQLVWGSWVRVLVGRWSNWSTWGPCTRTCGRGIAFKKRNCTNGIIGHDGCAGLSWERKLCYGRCQDSEEYSKITPPSPLKLRISSTTATFSIENQDVLNCYVEGRAFTYRGSASSTESGLLCQKWTTSTSPPHTFLPFQYPDAGLGDHRFCRSPNKDKKPWCFVSHFSRRWEYCAVKACLPENSKLSPAGNCFDRGNAAAYRGTESVTENGIDCQMWDSRWPHAHIYTSSRFPSRGLGNHNCCRSPDGDYKPWCFTVDPKVHWKYCNISECLADTGSGISKKKMFFTDQCRQVLNPVLSNSAPTILEGVQRTLRSNPPWHVALHHSSNGHMFCGGSIVSTWWVVTAAHCIYSDGDPQLYHGYVNRLRNYRWESTRKRIQFVQIFLHYRHHRSNRLANDIALLKLRKPLQFNAVIFPLCFGEKKWENYRMLTVSGGDAYRAAKSQLSIQDHVSVVKHSRCRKLIRILPKNVVCDSNKKHICQEIEGGALIGLTVEGRLELAGIISWKLGCATTFPSIYTKVFYFRSWILSTMNGH